MEKINKDDKKITRKIMLDLYSRAGEECHNLTMNLGKAQQDIEGLSAALKLQSTRMATLEANNLALTAENSTLRADVEDHKAAKDDKKMKLHFLEGRVHELVEVNLNLRGMVTDMVRGRLPQ